MHTTINLIFGTLFGIGAGFSWLFLSWLWGTYGIPIITVLFSRQDTGPSPIILDLVPAIAGGAIFAISIAFASDVAKKYLKDRYSRKILTWSAAAFCIMFAILYASFMFFLAYSASGFDSAILLLYGLAFICIPTWGAIWAVRTI